MYQFQILQISQMKIIMKKKIKKSLYLFYIKRNKKNMLYNFIDKKRNKEFVFLEFKLNGI